ncbi:MAG: type II toxin-antitoxin system PemK/MazF family toxin [Geminicoccaceae bacterium]
MQRGELWWASLPAPRGSEPGYRRPVVIVQSDAFNRSRIRTVIVVPLTSNLRLKAAPGNVFLAAEGTGLDRDSVIKVSQAITLDKAFLRDRIGRIPIAKLREIDEGLRLVLAL